MLHNGTAMPIGEVGEVSTIWFEPQRLGIRKNRLRDRMIQEVDYAYH